VSEAPFQRALVIRGGALGDFLLTLPVLHALREAAPEARLELLAYPGIAELATTSGIADGIRSIEYGPLAGFFIRGATLDPGLRAYFGSFDLVVSYLYDPDGFFAGNLRNAGVRRLVTGPHRPGGSTHAIDQLAAPLAELGLPLARRAARLRCPAEAGEQSHTVALHPGSGSIAKNWPAEHWLELAEHLLREKETRLAIVGGEADAEALRSLRRLEKHPGAEFWENLPLPELAGRLTASRLYVGHDTGVSHLAAVVGTPSMLLFGPTEPGVWAPPHEHVRILRAPQGRLEDLPVHAVLNALGPLMAATRLATRGGRPDNSSI
jgi:heptosyltransferase-2